MTNIYHPHRFCIAPMLDWSDRHARYFWRLLTRHGVLYTEMVTTGALIHGDRDAYLRFGEAEHPVALQLGGSDPAELAQCSRWAQQHGYDEINLNVGCPSDRVQSGRFGACLMADPELVADCVRAMSDACKLPVTVKHRIGIDRQDSYRELCQFIDTVSGAGCRTFIIHARKAWLQGLSPKQNRDIPPLQYERVYQVKRDFPALEIVINGGIETLDACTAHLQHVDGVMLGRSAYQQPWLLAKVDSILFGDSPPCAGRADVIAAMQPYIEARLSEGCRLHHITRHMIGLCHGLPGARAYRRHLSEYANQRDADGRVLSEAFAAVDATAEEQVPGAQPPQRATRNDALTI